MRRQVMDFINKKYCVAPEYLWRRYPTYCIFRHHDNQKWFALVGSVPRSVLKIPGDADVDIINVKTDNVEFLRGVPGILPAYHMNKNNWVSVLLDGSVPMKNVKKLLEMSYDLTM